VRRRIVRVRLVSRSDWSAGPMAAQQPIECVRPLLGKEKPRSGELDRRARSWDRLGQPVRPFHRKVDIVRGPDDQRRRLELTQLGLDGQSGLIVECADEALQIVGYAVRCAGVDRR